MSKTTNTKIKVIIPKNWNGRVINKKQKIDIKKMPLPQPKKN